MAMAPLEIGTDPVVPFVLACFATLIYYNVIELIVLCLATFKRHSSLYFWCLLITSTCLIPHTSGYIVLFFRPDVSRFVASRLNFVVHKERLLKELLILIIVNAILLHGPTIVLLYGTVSSNKSITKPFDAGYSVMEQIQLVGLCLQEALLSGIYVWETAKLLRLRPESRHRPIVAQLLIMNVLVLIFDFAVVIVEYAGFYAVQVMFKPVAYSIKLKLEYAVLGRLVQIAQGGSSTTDVTGFDTLPKPDGPAGSGTFGPPSPLSGPPLHNPTMRFST
ncbi:hypothetical protein BDV19DRAFT_401402 [Aspergillus venezuelensis]